MKKDLRLEIVEALERKTDDEIEEEFEDLIRHVLTDKQFWKYYISWKDVSNVYGEMEDWSIELKKEAIKDIKKMFKINS